MCVRVPACMCHFGVSICLYVCVFWSGKEGLEGRGKGADGRSTRKRTQHTMLRTYLSGEDVGQVGLGAAALARQYVVAVPVCVGVVEDSFCVL